uniref:restriction endonuclease subunit S n=1 Tax=Paenibacillus terrae TaxID=159743 RepID=UPI0016438D19
NLYYLFYLLITKRQDLENLAVGSVQKNLYISVLSTLKINVPELKKQNKIAKVLKNIDDKIVSNRQIIANLEELSQTLFKRWFIDFEFPDKNGTPYKSNGGEMIDSELGEIPIDWKVSKIIELDAIVSDHVANGSFKKLKENVEFVNADIKNNAIFVRNIDLKK